MNAPRPMPTKSLDELRLDVEQAAEAVVRLREAHRHAALESLRDKDASASFNVSRHAEQMADRDLETAVVALRRAREGAGA